METIENQNPFTESTALMLSEELNTNYADMILETSKSFCSFTAETEEQKAILFNATNSPDGRIKEIINEVIEVQDIYCETVTCTNKETGIKSECPRIVLITPEGKAYQSVSFGILTAVQKLIKVYGVPTWKIPVRVKIKQRVTDGTNAMLTLEVVTNKKK